MKVIKNGYNWCSRWYVEIERSAYCSFSGMDFSDIKRVYVYPNEYGCDISKCLKKTWKHYENLEFEILKSNNFSYNVDVRAYVESEDGEIHDISWYWVCEQVEYEEELRDLPF